MVMLVKDVMNPQVVVAKPEATVKEAAKIMSELKIGCLIVIDNAKIAGIVTEGDIISKVIAKGMDTEKTTLKEIMTKNVISVELDKNLSEAADIMVENKIKRLPVLDDEKLVGIITATDLISYEPKMIESLSQLFMMKTQRTVAG